MISLITDREEFKNYKSRYLKIFKDDKCFEENIFQNTFHYFLGFEFEFIFNKSFFEKVKVFISNIGEQNIIFYTIDPSPEYFYETFGKYNALNISVKNTDEELNTILMDDSTDELAMYSNDIAWFSNSSNDWAIVASRDWEIAIIGFTSLEIKMEFLKAFEGSLDMFTAVKEQVKNIEQMSNFTENIKTKYAEIIANYTDKI